MDIRILFLEIKWYLRCLTNTQSHGRVVHHKQNGKFGVASCNYLSGDMAHFASAVPVATTAAAPPT
jgi:hypothetical protein